MWKRLVLLLFILVTSLMSAYATHNKAGDITYTHISGLTYEITITIFTDYGIPVPPPIARKEIEIDWGDNTGLDSLRVISENVISPNTLKRIWVGRHTFPGPGSYRIKVEDPNRNAGVVNMCNSVQVPFTIVSLLRIPFSADQVNNSVVLKNDPLDQACINIKYLYNPGAFDSDGDSIAYEIAPSLGINGEVADCYEFPSTSDSITVDPITGDLIWDSPNQIGVFNVAILIKEYRNSVKISEVLRDLQIEVIPDCDNQPPRIRSEDLVCVEAENTLNVDITGSDNNFDDNVGISATGVVLEPPIASRTNFNVGPIGNPTNATFIWNTNCSDVRKQPYGLSIKAEDNGSARGTISLATFKTINIRVVAPPPQNFSLNPIGNSIDLSWTNGICQSANGYALYRRLDSSGFVPDSCVVGVPGNIGYIQIANISDISTTQFTDDNAGLGLVPGQKYCYLVTSLFTDLDDESIASVEICGEVEKVVPVITQVSVTETDDLNGVIDLEWSPPDVFDTSAFPPPYRYLIYEQLDNDGLVLIDSTLSIDDTSYTVSGINTNSQFHTYRIDLYSLGNNSRVFAGRSAFASSIFLSIESSDEALQLNWSNSVPWNNQSFVIYRKHPDSTSFDSLSITSSLTFTDTALTNGREYCYFIESSGSYNLASVKSPLLNLSQVSCAIPIDTDPPCVPEITVGADTRCLIQEVILSWDDSLGDCASDLERFNIYRSSTLEGELILLSSTRQSELRANDLISSEDIAGCFAISSIDSTGNESELSNIVCIEFCPIYELPNVFTPNGDGINDLYTPLQPYQDVDSIDIAIFNRWGEQVYHTNNPAINWNGNHMDQDELVSDGVYFYRCLVYEKSLSTILPPRQLKGTITIVDGKESITK